uniref:Uncharacterized protein n=1 Tax=Trichogramma kaykai TaxID=54128 RepID=A0ABD2W887_9HYME
MIRCPSKFKTSSLKLSVELVELLLERLRCWAILINGDRVLITASPRTIRFTHNLTGKQYLEIVVHPDANNLPISTCEPSRDLERNCERDLDREGVRDFERDFDRNGKRDLERLRECREAERLLDRDLLRRRLLLFFFLIFFKISVTFSASLTQVTQVTQRFFSFGQNVDMLG